MMATKIYEKVNVSLLDNTIIEISSLKLKYLHEFMDAFEKTSQSKNEMETISYLSDCVRIAMKQFYPKIKTVDEVEDSIDLKTMYKIINICSGINLDPDSQESNVEEITENKTEGTSWENLDLAKLESEVFVLGIWKNYEELEECMSLPELLATIERSRELDYDEKKFLAAMQGVDLDSQGEKEEDPWEALKARVAAKTSGIDVLNQNDITSFQGVKAQQAGFGIGMGLDYATDI